jgi:hypothetical protein
MPGVKNLLKGVTNKIGELKYEKRNILVDETKQTAGRE